MGPKVWLQEDEKIKQYKEGYWVTNFGRVYSAKSSKWLKLYTRDHKYMCYPEFKVNGETTTRVHRCVAELFVEKSDKSKDQVNHIDGNKSNNHYTNLEWVTQTENQQHAWTTGLHAKTEEHKRKLSVSNQGKGSKITEKDVRSIFSKFNSGIGQNELAVEFGICRQQISAILSGKYWSHLGLERTREVSAGGSVKTDIPDAEDILRKFRLGIKKKVLQKEYNISRYLLNRVLSEGS
jgi:hypothetical protein